MSDEPRRLASLLDKLDVELRGGGVFWMRRHEDAWKMMAEALLAHGVTLTGAPEGEPRQDVQRQWEALQACEEVLRLIHEAAGPVPKSAPMPRHSTFGAWRLAHAALGAERSLVPEGQAGHDSSDGQSAGIPEVAGSSPAASSPASPPTVVLDLMEALKESLERAEVERLLDAYVKVASEYQRTEPSVIAARAALIAAIFPVSSARESEKTVTHCGEPSRAMSQKVVTEYRCDECGTHFRGDSALLRASGSAPLKEAAQPGKVQNAERHGYVLAMEVLHSPLWENADEDVRLAVSIFVAAPIAALHQEKGT